MNLCDAVREGVSMHAKATLAVMAIALIMTTSASILLLNSNSQLNDENSAAETRLRMNAILSRAQMAVQYEIKKIDALMANASMRLSPLGLNGTLLQAEKMYYSRHYIDGWIKNGWVDGKDGRGRVLRITDSGTNVTDIFYLD